MGLGEAGVVDLAYCQKLGTLIKADLILFGSITQASLDDKAVAIKGLTTATASSGLVGDVMRDVSNEVVNKFVQSVCPINIFGQKATAETVRAAAVKAEESLKSL